MKQREYTELQWAIINVINRMAVFMQHNSNAQKEIDNIRKDYDIKEPYLNAQIIYSELTPFDYFDEINKFKEDNKWRYNYYS